jgi:biopolymer transport protein ExbB
MSRQERFLWPVSDKFVRAGGILIVAIGLMTLCDSWAPRSRVLRAAEPAEAGKEELSEPAAPASSSSAAATAGEPPAPKQPQNLLDTIKQGGPVGAVIIFLSMVAVGLVVEHGMTIRKSVIMPENVVQELDDLIQKGRIDEAIEACCEPANQCLFSHVVLAGLERYKGSEFGFAEYKAAAEEAGEDQTARLYRKTEYLGVIGTVAPMLGLLGTVTGMIRAFNVIASTGGMARPDQLASGISEALVTTVEGLVVAIPTMMVFTYFRSRIDSLVAEAGKRVEQVLMPLSRRKA